MAIFIINTVDLRSDGLRRYLNVESSHPSLEALAADLRKGPVVVRHLQAHKVGNEMHVTASRPVMITAAFVMLAELSTIPFVDAEPAREVA